MSVDYSSVLRIKFPNTQWTGSGRTYNSIKFISTAIPRSDLDLLMPEVELLLIKKTAITRLTAGYEKYIKSGYLSSGLGTPHMYHSTMEAQTDLNSIMIVAINNIAMGPYSYMCEDVSTGLTFPVPHTLAQLKVVVKDGYTFKEAGFNKLIQQITSLDSMSALQQKQAIFVP